MRNFSDLDSKKSKMIDQLTFDEKDQSTIFEIEPIPLLKQRKT